MKKKFNKLRLLIFIIPISLNKQNNQIINLDYIINTFKMKSQQKKYINKNKYINSSKV